MTTMLNDRDVLILNTVPRSAPPTDRALLLDSTAQVFKVSAGGGSPTSITLSAKLLNMTGTVTWSATGASTLDVTGNVAVLDYADMVGGQTTVTASITVDGQPYTSGQVITKINDGVTGKSARRAYSKTTLTSLSATPTTITTAGDTSYPPNNSWGTGTVWGGSPHSLSAGEQDYVSDGIYDPVTDITTWQVPYLANLKVGQLSAIVIYTGALNVDGTITMSSTGAIQIGTAAWTGAAPTGTGVVMSYKGIASVASDVAQFSLNAATGAAYFGGTLKAGIVTSDSLALSIGGDIHCGQTAYDTGTGFWMSGGATPLLSIGVAGGPALLWNGSTLTVRKATFDSFSVSVSGSLLTAVANGLQGYGNLTATVSGGASPYQHNWGVTYSSASGIAVGYTVSAGAGTSVASFGGSATNMQILATITLTVTDSNGRTATVIRSHSPIHGTYAP